MRRSLGVRLATCVLVLSLAAPAFAAPNRTDSPFDGIERMLSRLVDRVIQILDLSQINPPK
jgi:hypothetical protein